jgi:putative aldouronate transport system substrate-binding protein
VAHANPSGQFIVVRKGYEHPELAIKIINLFYDKLANDKDVATSMPEAAKYLESGVDGSTRPFNIEVNSATSLLDDYSDVVRGIKGEIGLDQVRTTESKNNIGSIQTYLKDQDTDDITAWSKYHSRMNGVGLIDKLTQEGKFNWMTPAFSGTTPSMKQTWANLTKMEQESFIKIITGAEPLDYFETFVSNWKKQGGDQVIQEIEAETKTQK